jgi:hypothetical protein
LQTIIPELGQGEEYNSLFCEAEMLYALSTCKGYTPGLDEVHYEMPKRLTRVAKLKLIEIYNEIRKREVFSKKLD